MLKLKTPKKEYFQLTATADGKKVFSKEEMKEHLMEIIKHNEIIQQDEVQADLAVPQAAANPQSTSRITYTDSEERSDHFERRRLEMGKNLDEERRRGLFPVQRNT